MEARLIDLVFKLKAACKIEEQISEQFSLTPREVSCLQALSESAPMLSGVLAKAMNLSPSRGSRIINSLIGKEFLQGEADKTDRRKITLNLTKKGKACMKKIEQEKDGCEKKILTKIDSKQHKKIMDSVEMLLSLIGTDKQKS